MNQAPKNFWTMLTALAAALVVFTVIAAIFGIRAIGNVGTDRNNISTISVDGTGWALSTPDVATFSFTVTESAKAVADAQKAATDRVNAALKAVRAQGVDDKDISTQSYNINPHYDYQTAICPAVATPPGSGSSASSVSYCPGGKSVLTGYDVSETIQVKVRDLSKAGTIFSSIGSLGVQNVNGLDFSVDDPTAIQAEARRKAIDDARSKAEVLAQQLGVSLARVVSFSENSGNYPRPVMYAAMAKGMGAADSAAVAPEVPTGEQKITENVSITYEIR